MSSCIEANEQDTSVTAVVALIQFCATDNKQVGVKNSRA